MPFKHSLRLIISISNTLYNLLYFKCTSESAILVALLVHLLFFAMSGSQLTIR